MAFNSVDAQLSDGNSIYNGLTVNVQKRFSNAFELLSSYTWSHTIDDSTDLQSPLEPQDSRFPFFERSNSDFDQRHRWVTSAVFQSPAAKSGDGAWKHFIGDFTLSPIIELSLRPAVHDHHGNRLPAGPWRIKWPAFRRR